jgi:hypothetical protein
VAALEQLNHASENTFEQGVNLFTRASHAKTR